VVILVNKTPSKEIFEKSGCRYVCTRKVKVSIGTSKIHPTTGYEGPEGK
jgi:hypothetical protein